MITSSLVSFVVSFLSKVILDLFNSWQANRNAISLGKTQQQADELAAKGKADQDALVVSRDLGGRSLPDVIDKL